MDTASLRPLTLARLALCGEGRLVGEDRVVDCISTDSRSLPSGALFAALRGERYDQPLLAREGLVVPIPTPAR